MAQKKTYRLTDLTIGSKVYVVHKDYAFQKKSGGVVKQARVISFRNTQGEILTEFKITGNPNLLGEKFYAIFTDVKKAIQSIKSK